MCHEVERLLQTGLSSQDKKEKTIKKEEASFGH